MIRPSAPKMKRATSADSLEKPFTAIVYQDSLTVSFAGAIIPEPFEEVVIGQLLCALSPSTDTNTNTTTTQQENLPISVLNHPPQTAPNTTTPTGEGGLLHAEFLQRVKEHPDRPALDFLRTLNPDSHDIFTYAELDRLSSQLAEHILHLTQSTTLNCGHLVVPAFLSTSPELYICWLGVLKADCAFCPLPVDAPLERLQGILEETSSTVILGRGPASSTLSPLVSLDASPPRQWVDVTAFIASRRNSSHDEDAAASYPTLGLPSIRGADLAYVMYTSGSTGKPKGVQITHHAASCSISSHVSFAPTTIDNTPPRWFQFAAPTFDPSVMEIFTTLSVGGTLCFCERSMSLTDPEAAITALRATIMMATPSMAALLRPRHVPTLKHLWTMGENLGRKVIESFASDSFLHRDEGDVRHLLNAYGPTEGSINCTLQADFSVTQRGSNIGGALATCSMLVLDADPHSSCGEPKPVPLGFSGELAIGGPQVSPGYLNRPEQTAAAFVESAVYGRLYRTGDRARIVQGLDGGFVVDFLGRITTDQVKLSGRRVDLGDIEAVIAAVPAVAEVAAVAHQQRVGEKGSEQVVVCIVPRESGGDLQKLLDECQQKTDAQLQPYMRPKRYFVTDVMPRSAAGKIDRKRIGAMISASNSELVELIPSFSQSDSIESWQENETTSNIVNLLAEITGLSREEIAPDAGLQAIGLDSLRAVRFLQQLRTLDIDGLAINDVLAQRTVAELVALCTGSNAVETQTARSAQQEQIVAQWTKLADDYRQKHLRFCAESLSLTESEIETVLPTTSTQAGMLASFLRSQQQEVDATTAHASSYINHSVYEIASDIDIESVVKAWQSGLARNEMLRTVFVQVDEEISPFAQCVLSHSSEHTVIQVHRYNDGPFDTLVQKALSDAETNITLERPAYKIALVTATEKSAIVFSLAHPIFDGGSLQLMVQDVERAFRQQEPLPRTSISTAVSRHFSSDRESSAAYWRKELEGNSSEPFPCLRSHYPGKDKETPNHAIVQSKLRIDDLRNKSRKLSSSPLSVLHAAWSLILFAYTGTTSDVTFGSVISDRLDEEMAQCLAPTFVTVPTRVCLPKINANSPATAAEVAQALTKNNIASLNHLHTPLSSVLSAEGGLPYDTLFAFQDFPADNAAEGGLYTKVTYPPMKNDFAVMVEVWPTASGQIELKATYDRKLLDEVAAECMVKQLDAAIQLILEQPQATYLDGKTHLPQELSSGFAAEWSEIEGEEMLLHRPFENHAAANPDDLAVLFEWDLDDSAGTVKMTYRELNETANKLAHRLVSKLGTLENKVVPLCMEKCPELYVAVLGALKAGGAWCPVDPYSPPARQHDIIKRAEASVVLVAHSMSNLSPEAVPEGVEVIDITSCFATKQDDVKTVLPVTPSYSPSNIAYLIFTSGTTGPPKGVPITHAAGSAAMKSLSEVIPPSPPNMASQPLRCMQFSQFTFDVFVQDLFYTWRLGGAVVSATREVMIGSFARLANSTRATHAHLTPAFGSTVARKELETLRVITMIGEKLGQAVADDWGTEMLAYNTYGPAEAAVVSTVRQFGADGPPTSVRSSNVGWPLPSLGAYVIESGRPVMKNAIGELVLAGVQLSKGYWAAPEISATKMVYNEALGLDIYHTGDFCRQLADGSFDFVGRNDDLVKIAGQRVELSEIAHACRDGHPLVDQVEVLYPKRPGSETDNVLVCFLAAKTLDDGKTPSAVVVQDSRASEIAAAVLQKAQSLLPKHMVPTVTLVLNKIPRTPSAKVDRKELIRLLATVDMQQWDDAYKGNVVAAASAAEAEWIATFASLVDAVVDVARIAKPEVKPNSSLAAMGLDSIKAIRLTAKLRAAGYKVSVLDVFRCRTLGEVSDLLVPSKPSKPTFEEFKSDQDSDVDNWTVALSAFQQKWYGPACLYLQKTKFQVTPTSTTQEGMLTESMRQPLSYWGVHCFELSADVDIEKLQKAWAQVVSQTDALRVAFVPTAALPEAPEDDKSSSTFLQVVYNTIDLPWSELSVDGANDLASAVRTQLETISGKHHAAGYSQPPWHIAVVHNAERRYMVLNFHHAIYDGDSMGFLGDDLTTAYNQGTFSSGRCQLSEAMTRITLDTDEKTATAFWNKELQGFDASEGGRLMASKKPNPSGSIVHRTQEIKMAVSSQALSKIADSFEGLSTTTALRVAFGQMLSELMESPDVLFAEIKSDRVVDPRLQDAVAPLVSVIPVPFRATGNARALVKDQSRLAHEGLRNRAVRSSVIRNLTGKSPSEPLYPAVFVFHPYTGEETGADKEKALWKRMDDLVDIAVEHPLALNAFETADGHTTLSFSVDETIMTAVQQNVFVRQIDALVTALVSHPDQENVTTLTEFFPRELQSISAPAENHNCPANHMPTLWIERWAREHPDWKAVEVASAITDDGAETVAWTYAQLDKRANQIASFIASSHGISSQMIGMCLDSTLLSFAVLIGIMKSGNTYVPIEKDLPQERKMFLLEDSAAPMLFTSGGLFDRDSAHNVQNIIDVDDPAFLSVLDKQPDSFPTDTIDLEGNAYLLYTSGSTGKPKGVRVSRGNLSSFMEGQSQLITTEVPSTPGLAGKGKYLCLASRAFDVHLGETFLAWRHGLCAVTASRTLLLDDLELALRNLHVTHASFVPSLLDQTGLRPEDVPELRFLGVGGEKMTPRTQSIWASPRPGSGEEADHQVSLINAYGPTEATIGCCSGRLYKDSDTQNIGRPLGDCVAHVLVPGSFAHVKRGMPGELCFTGSFVGNGYHNRPDATGFVDDFHGEKMYRTGDIVALMPDDTIYFLGRKDDQVKVRGQRLELGEVSEAVRSAAAEAAVLEDAVWEHGKVDVQTLLLKHPDFMRQQLVSFVAAAGASKKFKSGEPPIFLEDDFASCNDALRPVVQRTHPAYMVPDLVVPVSYMPLTQTSAKADTKLLKSLFFNIPAAQLFGGHHGQAEAGDGDAPAASRELTSQEKSIVEIAQSFSTTNPAGLVVRPDTTIFQLGVDSLGAISVYARMKKMGYECSVATILSGATIEQLAALPIKRRKSSAKSDQSESTSPELTGTVTPMTDIGDSLYLDTSALVGIEPSNVAAVRPCLPLQEVLVSQTLAAEAEDETPYVNHIVLEMPDGVDVARLVNSWDRVIASNEILRTCFKHTDKGVVQVVFKADCTPLVWSQVTEAVGSDVKGLQTSLSRQIASRMDVQPPIRLTLLSSDNAFILSMHHALYDGESLPMIVNDVKETYLQGTAPRRPAIGSLIDHVSHKRTNAVQETKTYWTNLLSGWTPAELATTSDATESSETTVAARTFSRSLSALEKSCAQHSLTLPALLQAIFGVCLAQQHSHGIATYGAVLSGRTLPVDGIERMLAPCIVTLPQRVNLRTVATIREAVTAAQKAGFEVLDYQHTATRDIQAWVGADRPLFDAIFSFARKIAAASDDHAVKTVMKERDSQMVLDYALAVEGEADAVNDKLVVRAGFTAAFGSSLQADLLLEKMELLIEAVLRGEKTPVGEFKEVAASSAAISEEDGEWTALETEMRNAAADFCKVSAAGFSKSTSFIHMGIDSVTAIPFSRKLRELGIRVTASQVIRARCVGTLAQQVEAKRAGGEKKADTNVASNIAEAQDLKATIDAKSWAEGDEVVVVYPCTPLQTGMLSLTLAADSRLYSHHHTVTLSADIDVDRLQDAWTTIVAKNDILRTAFHWQSGAEIPWVAAVHKQPLLRWETITSSNIDEALGKVNEDTQFLAHADFELPPVKATLIQGSSQNVLAISMHHVTYDGMSVPLLFEDLQRAYLAQSPVERPPFSQAALTIANTTRSASDFWSRQMQGYRGIEIPLSDTERNATALTAATLALPVNPEQQLAIADVSMLAFSKALSVLVNARDVVFGQVVSGRNINLDGADAILGPLFNTVPFRLRLSQAVATNSDVLAQIRQLSEEAIDFQHAALAEVQKAWRQQDGGVAAANLFDSLFVFQKTVGAAEEQSDKAALWKPYEGEGGAQAPAEYALNFEVEQTAEGILVRAYSKLGEGRLTAFLGDFKAAFEDVVSHPAGLALSTPKALAQVPLEPIQATSNVSSSSLDQAAVDKYGPILIQALADFAKVSPDQLKQDTSIFALGLDSISAITIVSNCKRKGMKLSVVDIIQGITVGKICELAHAKASSKAKKQTVTVSTNAQVMLDDATKLTALTKLGVASENDVEEVLPILSGQEYHLAAWRKSGRTMYEPSWVFRTKTSLDENRLREAWITLRGTHSVLRSSFVATSPDRAVQVVLTAAAALTDDKLNFTVSSAGSDGLEAATKDLAHAIARAPSDLFTPPARLHLVHGNDGEGDAILVTVQHAAYDAWTMVRFIQQLEALYLGQTIPQPAPFAEFVQHTLTDENATNLKFWSEHLAGGDTTLVPTAQAPNTLDSKNQTFVMRRGSHVDITALEAAARKHGATPQALLVLAYAQHLNQSLGTKQPAFGLFHLGRSSAFEYINEVFGPTINMLPFTTTAEGASLSELLTRTQAAMAARVPHEQSRLRSVLKETGVGFNTGLNLLWNDGLIVGEEKQAEPLLTPFAIGVPTDYSSPTAIVGRTAVDELDVDWISGENVFVDVGPNRETGCVDFGVRSDAVVFDEAGLQGFVDGFENTIRKLVRALGA